MLPMKLNVEKVKTIMERKRLSAEDLARLMDVHRQVVYETLYGKTGKTLKTITRLAQALGVKETDLLA